MKRIFSIILISCISYNLFSQQVQIPYYEPFDNNSYTFTWQVHQGQLGRIMSTPIHYNDFANSLKIEVREDDHPAMSPPYDGRTRAEIALPENRHKINNNDRFYYSWDIFIPEQIYDLGEYDYDYYVIMQWHEEGDGTNFTYCNNPRTSPENKRTLRTFPVSLRLAPDTITGSKVGLRLKLGTTYGPGNCSENKDICPEDYPYSKGYREFQIPEALKLGEWNHIVTEIKWSYVPDNAYFKMWINEQPIKRNNPGDYVRCTIEDLHLGQTNENADVLDQVALMYNRKSGSNIIAETNYQKLGHYRRNYTSTNTYYIDNYRITTEYPPEMFKTSITNKFCNKILAPYASNYLLEAYELSPANEYRFEFFNYSTNEYQWATSYNNKMNLLTYNWIKSNQKYKVRVRALNSSNNGDGFPYGKECDITTPEATKLKVAYCGTDSNPYQVINSNGHIDIEPLPGSTDYLYKLTNVDVPDEILYYPSNFGETFINVYDLYGIKPHTKYKVEVRARRLEGEDDVYINLGYGLPCFIITNNLPNNKNYNPELIPKITIAPNPTKDFTKISLDELKIHKVEVINFQGRTVLKKSVNSNTVNLNLRNLDKGIYQVLIIDEKGNECIERLIIK